VSLIKSVKARGYSITIFFLWIPDVRLARERIKQRVKDGGHDVPFEDVKRRFQRSRMNFLEFYAPLCDSWILFDNASGKPVEIAQKDHKGVKILNTGYYRWFTGER
jgi:predicted ABC-type ATPase